MIDADKQRMTCVSAGHEKPYLVSESGMERLNVPSNFVLGGIADLPYLPYEADLKGKRLFLFRKEVNRLCVGSA